MPGHGHREAGATSMQYATAARSILRRLRRSLASAATHLPFAQSGAQRDRVQRLQTHSHTEQPDELRSRSTSPFRSGIDAHTTAMWACLDALPECAWTATASGEVDFLNAQWYTYTGSSTGGHTGHAWIQSIHPDDIQSSLQDWAVAMRTHTPVRCMVRVRGCNADYRWFLVRARAVLDDAGNTMRWVGLTTDIHDRYTAEQQVGRERALLRDVLEQIPAAVIVGEAPSGKVIVQNHRMAQLWRCPSSMLGSYGSIAEYNSKPMKMWHLDGRPCREEDWPLAQAIQHGCTVIDGIATFERMDGTRGTLCVNATPVRDDEGTIIAGVMIAEDMQNRLAAEEERVRLRADEAAARKTAELKQLLMANVSHEMRTPLNAIIGMGSVLLSDAAAQRSFLTAEQVQCITDMRDSGQLLLTLVDDILTFSHLEAGKLTLSPAQLQLRQLVARASNVMAGQAREKRLTITTRIDPDLPTAVVGDEMRLRQVLVNLLSNAVKFTPEGGSIRVHVGQSSPCAASSTATQEAASEDLTARPSSPLAELQRPSGPVDRLYTDASTLSADSMHAAPPAELRIRFSVEDTGIGVPTDALSRLFKPFSQADATTTRKYGGTGLGLSICKRLVEAMGGDIGVAVRAGGGARFWFEVPMYPALPSDTRTAVMSSTNPDSCVSPVHDYACASECPVEKATAPAGVPGAESTLLAIRQDVRPLAGVRVLVAEVCGRRHWAQERAYAHFQLLCHVQDNVVNERVVPRILTREGAHVTIVDNGAAAVHAVTNAQPMFHVVLMDCAMPVCDGYEATKLIRGLPDAARRNVPITALTAGALPEDVQSSFDAGMNAHVAKPLDSGSLVATVRHMIYDFSNLPPS